MDIIIGAGVLASFVYRYTYAHTSMNKWNGYREFRHINMDNYDTKEYGSNKMLKRLKVNKWSGS